MLAELFMEMIRQGFGERWDAFELFFNTFATMFLSVLFGALPFILVAVLASGFVELFVSRNALQRLLPRHPVLGILLAPLVGFFIPLCECAVIPVAGRLIRKGLPLAVGITFMLANPIFNPVPLYATAVAFPFHAEMVILRAGAGYAFAVVIGLMVLAFVRGQQVRGIALTQYATPAGTAQAARLAAGEDPYRRAARAYHRQRLSDRLAETDAVDAEEEELAASADTTADLAAQPMPLWQRIRLALEHAGVEFFVVGKYFVIGAFLASLVQATVPRSALAAVGQADVASVAVMMAFAYALNICSEADAFVAAGFTGTFKLGGLLAFLTLGPMADVKNTLMMFATFRKRFTGLLLVFIFATVFVGSVLANVWLYWE